RALTRSAWDHPFRLRSFRLQAELSRAPVFRLKAETTKIEGDLRVRCDLSRARSREARGTIPFVSVVSAFRRNSLARPYSASRRKLQRSKDICARIPPEGGNDKDRRRSPRAVRPLSRALTRSEWDHPFRLRSFRLQAELSRAPVFRLKAETTK